uniref:RHD domain-containing protein n=1 Tax=Mola mola TaxID=94237 RepID=A0A3Q4BCI0_MOLML
MNVLPRLLDLFQTLPKEINPRQFNEWGEQYSLEIYGKPKERGMRFRYECEGRSAGSILGASSTETNKTQPAIEVRFTVSLVTKDPPHRPHPHCLVGKDCPNGSGICVVTINPNNNRRHSFVNLGIQCVRRKELDVSLQKRRSQNIDPFQTGDSKGIEDMDMNAVRLCFQCELEWDDGRKDCLSPVVSNAIYDKKATTTSQLKISCLNQYRGPCKGKTEIFMLCDKVQKDDIEIIFRHGSWKAKGEFAQTDVHRQIAIVFKTPPYQDQDITEEVEVSVILHRLSDQMESEPVSFTYLPYNPGQSGMHCVSATWTQFKMHLPYSVTQFVFSPAPESAPPAEQPFHFPQPQTVSQDERLCAAQPGTSAIGEACYNEVLDSCNNKDEVDSLILNHLLEVPGIWEMISEQNFPSGFEQGPDTGCTFGAVDMNQNFQDFSRYNDLQFNMLVSDNHSLQSEAQDSSMVEVKKEEEL